MRLSRRAILKGAGALPLLAGSFGLPLLAVAGPGADGAGGGSADPVRARQWRPCGALDHHPVAHGIERRAARANGGDQFHRSPGAHRRQSGAGKPFLDRRPAPRARRGRQGIAAPHRRGAHRPGRQFARRLFDPQLIKNGGGADISHAVLCGVPNHGVYDWDDGLGGEFNGRGPFLRGLNEGESEVTPGTAFLTLRSDGIDKYAQADGRFVGKPGTPTGVTSDGPALKGATNLVLGALDHREVAFHPRAFREIYKFIAGQRAVAHRDRAGSGSQTERAGDGHAGRRGHQPSGIRRDGRNLSRLSRIPANASAGRSIRRKPVPTAAGARRRSSRPGISKSCWHRPARRRRISIARRFRAPPTSCICAPRARSGRPMPARAPWS